MKQSKACIILTRTPYALAWAFILCCCMLGAGTSKAQLISTIAGNGVRTFAGDGGPATSASLYSPSGMAIDAFGNIYIADVFNERIRKITKATGIISTVAGNGTFGFSGDGSLATNAMLAYPCDIKIDGSGNLYIADAGNGRIRKVTAATGIITTIAGYTTSVSDPLGDGGPATSAAIDANGLAIDRLGNIYIPDRYHNRIRKITAATGTINTVAGNGTAGFGGDAGPATNASLNSPTDVAIDRDGNIYIADAGNNRIRWVDGMSGVISTCAGSGSTYGFSGDGGLAINALLHAPNCITLDGYGNFYIADGGNDRIRKVTAATGIINTLAGNGTTTFAGDGNLPINASLYLPSGVALDALGNIYIVDGFHDRIRKISKPFNSLEFDGIDDQVSIADQTSIAENMRLKLTDNFTIECWFLANALGDGALIHKGAVNTTDGYQLDLYPNKLRFVNAGISLTGNTTLTTGTWYHVAVTFQNGVTNGCKIYLNGVLDAQGTPTGPGTATVYPLTLGTAASGKASHYSGRLDEVRIWERVLCPSELHNNKNGALPNPASQRALIAYYQFDQGLAQANNVNITTLEDASIKGNTGLFTGFALTGITSNFSFPALPYFGGVAQYAPADPSSFSESVSQTMNAGPTPFYGCGHLATINPSGSDPIYGLARTTVTLDPTVQSAGWEAYVQRHYDIATDIYRSATATATVTLYYTKEDFAAFNAVRGSLPSLPIDPADAANYRSNLRITQCHGLPSGGNAPANYTAPWTGPGDSRVLIIPTSVVFNFNGAAYRWEVTFPVTGLGGFFASTNRGYPLQVPAANGGSYFRISPVPAAGLLTIETNDETLTTAAISDLQGRTIMHFAIKSGVHINIAALAPGMYMLKTNDGHSYKIIKG